MILRRFMLHLKEQNFIAVGLDILVVIIGIFLGMQVTDWNDSRKQEAARHDMLIALKAEVTASKAEFDRALTVNKRLHQNTLIALEALQKCRVEKGQEEMINSAFVNYQSISSIPIERTTYDEMKASGHFANIQNIPLKRAISELYYSNDQLQLFQTYMRRDLSATSRILWDYVDYGFESKTNDWGPGTITASIDITKNCQHRVLRNAVWEIADSYSDWSFLTARVVDKMTKTLTLLEQEIQST